MRDLYQRLGLFALFIQLLAGCGAEPGTGRADHGARGLDDATSRGDARIDGQVEDLGAGRTDGAAADAVADAASGTAGDAATDADTDAQVGAPDAGAPRRYLALGDSYTIGESVGAPGRFPETLVARLAEQGFALAAPEIIARTGWTTAQLAAAIEAGDPQGPYPLVTLLVGVNDQFRGGTAEAFEPALQSMLATAIDLAGAPCGVVVLTIPDYGQTPFGSGDAERIGAGIDAFNGVVRSASAQAGVVVVDITDISRRGLAEPALVARDGLHPSAAQYAEWVTRLAPAARVAATCAR